MARQRRLLYEVMRPQLLPEVEEEADARVRAVLHDHQLEEDLAMLAFVLDERAGAGPARRLHGLG